MIRRAPVRLDIHPLYFLLYRSLLGSSMGPGHQYQEVKAVVQQEKYAVQQMKVDVRQEAKADVRPETKRTN